jgi:hypothetical protein
MAVTSITANPLLELTRRELDDVFARSAAGPMPGGSAAGRALIGARSRTLSRTAAWLVTTLAWKGKVFDPGKGELVNRLAPFGLCIVRARVYKATSWVDGREAIVLDYARTSLLARSVRDEIREVERGVYLGVVFWRGRKVLRFLLEAEPDSASAGGRAA